MRFVRWYYPPALWLSVTVMGFGAIAFHLPVPVHRFATVVQLTTGADGVKSSSTNELSFGNSVCRVVASSDGKLPSSKSILPDPGDGSRHIVDKLVDKLDMIYHALSHEETRNLEYLETEGASDIEEEKRLFLVLRKSLEDAGFPRLRVAWNPKKKRYTHPHIGSCHGWTM